MTTTAILSRSNPEAITVRRHPFNSPIGRQLIAELDKELSAQYADLLPDGYQGNPTPDPESQILKGDGSSSDVPDSTDVTFLVAFTSSSAPEVAGCVVVLNLSPETRGLNPDEKTAELKRMYVRPGFRRSGVAPALMVAFEAEARRQGLDVVVLTTGFRQVHAVTRYERSGWTTREPYGEGLEMPEDRRGMIRSLELRLR